VDRRTDIRDFLASRRARITPERAGLPDYGGHRRVAGLRREEVALLAGVSVDYYIRLEGGNLTGVSDSVLEALVRALQLDEGERAHLFDLARAANTSAAAVARGRRRPAPHLRPAVQRLLDAMTMAPAYVRNGRLDVSARTSSAGRVRTVVRQLVGGARRAAAPHRRQAPAPHRRQAPAPSAGW
jgi:transcriptional regulator with XRE-family HTH domain